MATRTESSHISTLAAHTPDDSKSRVIPVPPKPDMSSHVSDAMDISSPGNTTSQAQEPEPIGSRSVNHSNTSPSHQSSSASMPAPPPAAAAAVHQPKIVQTAFIHKLYNMLEDSNIQHLISWSASADSFVMSPSPDFSKVLSQYFKHTNISSFVRQLNMYGFHKERDVFHTGNPDTTLWEFKHGNGNFKRGDLVGLREIKRRASRHALVHRENNYPKSNSSQPGTPAEPAPPVPPDTVEGRLANAEHSLFDMGARLQRSEENAHYMQVKNQAAMETMGRLLHFSQELSRAMLSFIPPENPAHRDVVTLQGEMQRQADIMRTWDESHDAPYANRQQYFGGAENAPVSPRQLPQDDSRRNTLAVPQGRGQPFYRPAVPSNLSLANRRQYGSISGAAGGNSSVATQSSPLRNAAVAPPAAPPHPLSNVEPPPGSLARRHTSADIRAHGWQASPSPYSSNPPSAPWPSSPSRAPQPDEQRIRESLSTYSLSSAAAAHSTSRPTTPPSNFPNGGSSSGDTFGSWSWNSALNRDGKGLFKDSSAPPTRRGSMAHILNPSDMAERSEEEDDPRGEDDRKRKRMQ